MRTVYCQHKISKHWNTIVVEDEIPDFILAEWDVYDELPQEPETQPEKTFRELKENKLREIVQLFINSFKQGYYSQTLSTTINCRIVPYCQEDDLRNAKSLYNYMVSNNISETYYRDYFNTNIPNVTQEMVKNIIKEMEDYVVQMYQKKHQLVDLINACTTREELEAIQW